MDDSQNATSDSYSESQEQPASTPLLQQLQALTSATLAISSELDLDKALQKIAETAREFAQARYAAVGIVNYDGIITSFITSGISTQEREQIGEPPRGHGLLGVLIKQGQPLRVRDMSKDPRRCGFPPYHPPMTSLLGVPISLQGRVIGDLYLTDKIGQSEFSPEDVWWITLFARQAAVAVENANLYQKMREARQKAQTLAELTSALNRAVEPAALFEQITSATCRLLEVPAAALYLLDEQDECFKLQAQLGLYQDPTSDLSLPLKGSIAGQVRLSNKPVSVYDTELLSKTYFLALQNKTRPRAILVVPIQQSPQGFSGVIEVYAAAPRHFSPEEITLLEAFAGQAALMLERMRLYQQKEEFLSMTAHDLRAPLTAIKMSAGLLETSLPPDLPPPILRLVANVSHNSERLNNLLEDLLDLTRMEQGQIRLHLQRVDLGEVVAAIAQTLAPLFEGKEQKLMLEPLAEPVEIELDRHRFEQTLVNLLVNAHKYSGVGGSVTVSFDLTAEAVTILIKDDGPGIPKEEQTRIFDRYYRRASHEQTSETTGSGLGLPIARQLVELHGGKLWVESEPNHGSTFYLKLPRAK